MLQVPSVSHVLSHLIQYSHEIDWWYSNFSVHQNPEGLVKTDPRPAPKVSDPRGLGEELIVCISNKFLCYADAAGLGATLNITEVGISVLSTLEVRKWAQ